MFKQLLLCTLTVLFISACATDLTETGSNVQLLNSAADASKCRKVAVVFASARFGANNAVKAAMNKAADVGANAIYILSTTEDARSNSTSIVANAFTCPMPSPSSTQ